MKRIFTPENINKLDKWGVFVFGSNLNGSHAGGAARFAVDNFGAIDGQAEGLQGQSYAIPTLDKNMNKLSIDDIRSSIERLIDFASKNEHLEFFVTKIGCGIAGFEEKEIISLFHSIDFSNSFNIILPMEFSAIHGFKGFDKDMTCRGMKFDENGEYHQYGNISLCENGIHFCENPINVLCFYGTHQRSLFYKVVGTGEIDTDGIKTAVSDIKVGLKVDFKSLLNFGFNFIFKKTNHILEKTKKRTQGDSSTAATQGDSSTAATRGNFSTAISKGKNSVSLISGAESRVMASVGSAIFLTERDGNNNIIAVSSAIVDGEKYKPNIFYTIKNGKIIKAENQEFDENDINYFF